MLTIDLETATTEQIARLMRRGETAFEASIERARPILEAVRAEGDAAVQRSAREFDGYDGSIEVSEDAIQEAPSRIPQTLRAALEMSARRIESYHKRQAMGGFEFEDECGVFGQKMVPLGRVGVYAPGGTASYASSVLMAAIPARVAGVDEIVLCSPPRNGEIDNVVLSAAAIAGVDEVYAVGGAQAIAAMAYGTETIDPVAKIVGPGGSIVTASKYLVQKDCEIDFLAGPSEVLIIADEDADPTFAALEMLAQLEHDANAMAMMISPSQMVMRETEARLTELLRKADRREILERSSETGAVFLKVRDLEQALVFSNNFAPEHLVIDTGKPRTLLDGVRAAGSVFLGPWSSVAFGDYCAGTNHVLPTMGMARSQSALSVFDFIRSVPYQQLTREGAGKLARVTATMAMAEGLPAHARAANARKDGDAG